MKLKQLARTFLKVGRIIDIVLIPLFAILLVVLTIINIVAIAAATADGNDAALAAATNSLASTIVGYILAIILAIVSLILTTKASRYLETAKSKAEARPGAIMGIIAGALMNLFPIASGILMLVIKEEDWSASEEAVEAEVREEEPRE